MTDLALVTAGDAHVVESFEQITLPLGESINIGQIVRIDGTTGKLMKGNGTTSTEAGVYGVLASKDRAGAVGTAIKHGVIDGFALSALAYWAAVYASDTDGTLADAAGTVSKIVGRVIPATATTTGTAFDKLLLVDL